MWTRRLCSGYQVGEQARSLRLIEEEGNADRSLRWEITPVRTFSNQRTSLERFSRGDDPPASQSTPYQPDGKGSVDLPEWE
jgi:hypothetical protein